MEGDFDPGMNTYFVEIHKAGRIKRDEPTANLTIQAHVETPDFPIAMSLDTIRRFHEDQGRRLCDALFATLPGGTLDQLLRFMMEKRATLFVVRF
jgi:hypothetical protein